LTISAAGSFGELYWPAAQPYELFWFPWLSAVQTWEPGV
jgi:hypothetical protein